MKYWKATIHNSFDWANDVWTEIGNNGEIPQAEIINNQIIGVACPLILGGRFDNPQTKGSARSWYLDSPPNQFEKTSNNINRTNAETLVKKLEIWQKLLIEQRKKLEIWYDLPPENWIISMKLSILKKFKKIEQEKIEKYTDAIHKLSWYRGKVMLVKIFIELKNNVNLQS